MILARKIIVYHVRDIQVSSLNKGNSSGSTKIDINFASNWCSYSCKQCAVLSLLLVWVLSLLLLV